MSDEIMSTGIPVQPSTPARPEEPSPTTDPAEKSDQDAIDGVIVDSGHKDETSEYITGIKLYAVIAGLTMVAFLMMLDSTIVTTAIPSITSRFNSVKDIGWYGSSYLIANCVLQPVAGKLYQFYNSKFIFLGAVAVFELGSLICAVATSSPMFIIGRAIAGSGGAGVLNGALTILAASAPLDKRPVLLGLLIGIASLGAMTGPIIGGGLTQHASWRWCFYLNLPIGAVTLFTLSFVHIPDAKVKSETKTPLSRTEKLDRLDPLGFATFTPAVSMFLLAIEWGGSTYPWGSAKIIGLLCGSFGMFCIFLVWEHSRGDMAMLPLSLFRNRVIACACLVSAMAQGGFFLIFYYLPTWFQAVKGLSPTASGVRTLPSVVSMSASTVITGFFTSRTGYYAPFITAGAAGSAVSAGLLTTLTPSSGIAAWVCYQLLFGAAMGMIRQGPIVAVQAVSSKDQLAVATSLVTFCLALGAALFISFGQTAFANALKSGLKKFAPEVDVSDVLNAGSTNFKSVIDQASIPGVIQAYNNALTTAFYLAIGTACVAFIASFGLKWINLKTKKKAEEANNA